MTPHSKPYILLLAAVLQCGAAMAERADRDKPMHIESDTLRYDDAKQTSVFTGKVVLTKGSMLMRGARLDVRQDPAGNQFGVVTAEPGELAFFRQKRDTVAAGPDEFMEGEAERIEYDSRADTVQFLGRAVLRRFAGTRVTDEIAGGVIVYDNRTSVLKVDGGAASTGVRSGRVRAVLTPRVEEAPGSGATAPAPTLRRSTTIGGDKK